MSVIPALTDCCRYGSLTPEDREEIGVMCKRLIDEGRLRYLRDQGFNSHLVIYIDKAQSLENVALLAQTPGERHFLA